MFDFNSTLEDVSNAPAELTNDIITSNMDIRCCFYGKYKLLLDMLPVGNTGFYKITNILEKKCYNSAKYIIPFECFDNIINNMKCIHSYISILGQEVDETSYLPLLNTVNTYNSLNVYNDNIFEIAYLYGASQGAINEKRYVFIKMHNNIIRKDIYNYYNTEFYNILKTITNNNVFDYKNYFKYITNSIIEIRAYPVFFEILNLGYIKFYRNISNPNIVFILFNYIKLYKYMNKKNVILDKYIKYMLGFTEDAPNITDFPHMLKNTSTKKIVFFKNEHMLEVSLTNNIGNIPDYILNLVRFDDINTHNIGLFKIIIK